MFYVSDYKNNASGLYWGITDTSDNVEEFYTFTDLKKFISQGIKIHGMSSNCGHICKLVDGILLVPNVSDNSLEFYSTKSSKIINKFLFSTVRNARNKVWFTGSMSIKKLSNTELCITCLVCVKYDYEFNGSYVIRVDLKTGSITSKLDDVMFVCDDANEAHSTIECTGGDCPNFITSITANKILKEKGMI